ncbi:MAG: hypothetical protein OXG24_06425 [Gammaproteobacteria bacterium]|nr:hypothetical protein [Gammaproteobacteria bacterium]
MKTVLTGLCACAFTFASSTALAGGATCATESTAAVDKVKIIETIHVSSEKKVGETTKGKVDAEVLKILKATDSIDQNVAKVEYSGDKLEIIETINVTSSKEIDADADDNVDNEVLKVLEEVKEVEDDSEVGQILIKDLSDSELVDLLIEKHETSNTKKSKPLKLSAIKEASQTGKSKLSPDILDINQEEPETTESEIKQKESK